MTRTRDNQSGVDSLSTSEQSKRNPLASVLLALLLVAFPPFLILWIFLRILGKRPKFSLGTALLAVLLIGSCATLWWRWEPWRVQVTFNRLSGVMVRNGEFSPDGQRVITANDDSTARVADAHTGVELLVLKGHKGNVYSAAFSPDGKRIVTASVDGTAKVWDCVSGSALVTLTGHAGAVRAAGFSPDGNRILTSGDDNTARIWDAGSGTQTAILDAKLLKQGETVNKNSEPGAAPVTAFSTSAFVASGPRVITFSLLWTAQLRDVQTGAALLQLLDATKMTTFSFPATLAFSPDGTKLLCAAGEWVRIWDAKSGAELFRLNHAGVRGAAFSPAGDLIASGGGSFLRLWDVNTGKELAAMEVPRFGVSSVAFSPDGRRILTGNYTYASIWERARQESGYGVFVLPELWLAVAFAGLLLRSLWRDISPLTAKPDCAEKAG